MKQQSLASQSVFEKYGRKSRRELFLDEMEQVVPWSALEALVRPHYAKAGNGRQPVGLSIMLRTYFVQQWFNLSDPGAEELLYESSAVRRFVGVDLGIASAPDETTVLRFRHLLEKHDLGGMMLDAVNIHLEAKSIKARSSMRPLSMRLPRPRTRRRNATPRCARHARESSGTSG
jgi:IS5 family transposase